MIVAALCMAFTACSEDDLDPESVIVVYSTEQNEFDIWLEANYVNPYNIDFKYRYEEIEADYNYYTVPADYDQSVELAHIVKYICIEAYDECAGIDFTRAYFPKEFFLIGTWEYRNNGTYILGTAEGGKKILLAGVNFLDTYRTSAYNLNNYYLKTIHHEFTHILNQTIDMPTSFQFITQDGYVADMWSEDPYDEDYLTRGFISAYSQYEYTEDFAEMLSMYICYDEDQWEEWMDEAGEEGEALIDAKLTIVRDYMADSWDVDIDELRDCIQRRQDDLFDGKLDLMDLTVE